MKRKFDFLGAMAMCLATAIVTLALASLAVYSYFGGRDGFAFISKLNTVRELVEERYVGEMDWEAAADEASECIVKATGDRWSYYMTAEEYRAYADRAQNSTKGIGVTVTPDGEGRGACVVSVVPSSPADRAGIKAGFIITEVGESSLAGLEISEISSLIKSIDGEYTIGFLDAGGVLQRAQIINEVVYTSPVSYELMENSIGYIRIDNFENGAASDSCIAFNELKGQGAEAFIFDVRSNPGGQLTELTALLDFLLPEGEIFISVSAEGEEQIYYSDAQCEEIPMAVLIDGNSYSAAEFFAAALREYGWATLIGQPSTGKARSQQTFRLSDGSAVHISTRNYLTPNRMSLAEEGGLVPDIQVELGDDGDGQLAKALEYLS